MKIAEGIASQLSEVSSILRSMIESPGGVTIDRHFHSEESTKSLFVDMKMAPSLTDALIRCKEEGSSPRGPVSIYLKSKKESSIKRSLMLIYSGVKQSEFVSARVSGMSIDVGRRDGSLFGQHRGEWNVLRKIARDDADELFDGVSFHATYTPDGQLLKVEVSWAALHGRQSSFTYDDGKFVSYERATRRVEHVFGSAKSKAKRPNWPKSKNVFLFGVAEDGDFTLDYEVFNNSGELLKGRFTFPSAIEDTEAALQVFKDYGSEVSELMASLFSEEFMSQAITHNVYHDDNEDC